MKDLFEKIIEALKGLGKILDFFSSDDEGDDE